MKSLLSFKLYPPPSPPKCFSLAAFKIIFLYFWEVWLWYFFSMDFFKAHSIGYLLSFFNLEIYGFFCRSNLGNFQLSFLQILFSTVFFLLSFQGCGDMDVKSCVWVLWVPEARCILKNQFPLFCLQWVIAIVPYFSSLVFPPPSPPFYYWVHLLLSCYSFSDCILQC